MLLWMRQLPLCTLVVQCRRHFTYVELLTLFCSVQERRSLLEQCKGAIDEMVGKLGDEEQICIDTHLATSEHHEVKLEKLHSDANDEYNDLRRR